MIIAIGDNLQNVCDKYTFDGASITSNGKVMGDNNGRQFNNGRVRWFTLKDRRER